MLSMRHAKDAAWLSKHHFRSTANTAGAETAAPHLLFYLICAQLEPAVLLEKLAGAAVAADAHDLPR